MRTAGEILSAPGGQSGPGESAKAAGREPRADPAYVACRGGGERSRPTLPQPGRHTALTQEVNVRVGYAPLLFEQLEGGSVGLTEHGYLAASRHGGRIGEATKAASPGHRRYVSAATDQRSRRLSLESRASERTARARPAPRSRAAIRPHRRRRSRHGAVEDYSARAWPGRGRLGGNGEMAGSNRAYGRRPGAWEPRGQDRARWRTLPELREVSCGPARSSEIPL